MEEEGIVKERERKKKKSNHEELTLKKKNSSVMCLHIFQRRGDPLSLEWINVQKLVVDYTESLSCTQHNLSSFRLEPYLINI